MALIILKSIIISLLLTIIVENTLNCASTSINMLIAKLELETESQIAILNSASTESKCTRTIIKSISNSRFTSIIFDFEVFRHADTSGTSILSIPKFSRDSTIYTLFEQGNLLNEKVLMAKIIKIISFVSQLFTHAIRPKFLFFICANGSTLNVINHSIETLLEFAWKVKFLDFTVLWIHEDDETIKSHIYVFYYNPFDQLIYRERFDSETIIFVDKIINVNGYPLKIPYVEIKPYMMKVDGNYIGLGHKTIEFLAKVYNFTLSVIENHVVYLHDNRSLSKKWDIFSARQKLQEQELDILPLPFFMEYLLMIPNENEELSQIVNFDDALLITPVLRKSKSFADLMQWIILTTGIIMVILIYTFGRYISRRKDRLSVFLIIRILLGQPISKPFKKVTERSLIFYFIILSMKYFSNFYAELTESKLIESELSIQSYKDIDRLNMKIQVSKGLIELLRTHINSLYFPLKVREIENIQDCVELIVSGKDVLCFTTKFRVIKLFQKYKNLNDKSSCLRIYRLPFHSSEKVYIFPKGFPFMKKFDRIFQTIIESDLMKMWINDQEEFKKFAFESIDENDKNSSNLMVYQLMCLAIVGCVSSIVILLMEIAYNVYSNRRAL